jgi:hypothetical protein
MRPAAGREGLEMGRSFEKMGTARLFLGLV